jgi:hypothetical protein
MSELLSCRGCGFTDLHAEPAGGGWALLDIESPSGICSACAETFHWHPALLATIGFDDEAADEVLATIGFDDEAADEVLAALGFDDEAADEVLAALGFEVDFARRRIVA